MDVGIKQVGLLNILFLGVVTLLSLISIQVNIFNLQNDLRHIVHQIEYSGSISLEIQTKINEFEGTVTFNEVEYPHYEICISKQLGVDLKFLNHKINQCMKAKVNK